MQDGEDATGKIVTVGRHGVRSDHSCAKYWTPLLVCANALDEETHPFATDDPVERAKRWKLFHIAVNMIKAYLAKGGMTLGTLQEFYKKLVGAYWTAYQAERKQSGWTGTEWLRSDKGQEMIQHWSEVVSKNKAFVTLSRKAAEKKVKGMAAIRDRAHNSGDIDGDSDSDHSNDDRKKKKSLKAYKDWKANDNSSSASSSISSDSDSDSSDDDDDDEGGGGGSKKRKKTKKKSKKSKKKKKQKVPATPPPPQRRPGDTSDEVVLAFSADKRAAAMDREAAAIDRERDSKAQALTANMQGWQALKVEMPNLTYVEFVEKFGVK